MCENKGIQTMEYVQKGLRRLWQMGARRRKKNVFYYFCYYLPSHSPMFFFLPPPVHFLSFSVV